MKDSRGKGTQEKLFVCVKKSKTFSEVWLEATGVLRERLGLWFIVFGLDLFYGCVIFGSAAKSVLCKLDWVQAQALRICGGSFKATHIPALLIEMGEMLLKVRRNIGFSTEASFVAQGQDMFHSDF